MNIAKFEPWSLLNVARHDLDPFFTQRLPVRAIPGAVRTTEEWSPAVDIIEEAERFVLRADLPGVDPEDIDISMEKDVLSLAGERISEKTDDADHLHRVERFSGRFLRRFTLPDSADTSAISARSNNGILEVIIPKQAEVQSRRISVEAA
jgi:HSP20 family protein